MKMIKINSLKELEATEYKVRCYSNDRSWTTWIKALNELEAEDLCLADPYCIGCEIVGMRFLKDPITN